MTIQKELENGFQYLEIKNSHAHAKIALQGAHLFHYQAKEKKPLLWLSDLAHFEEGKAIRGGIPICFPWFGKNREDKTLAQHGFARNQQWKLMLTQELADGSTHLQLLLTPNKETRKVWDYNFLLIFNVTIGAELTLSLTTINCDTQAFEITQALHTYFNVSNIQNIAIKGLEQSVYYDTLERQLGKQHGVVSIKEEVDRVYFDAPSKIILEESERAITLNSEGSNSLVIWNPWHEKTKQMSDMPDKSYQTMVCLETANVLKDFVLLRPNESHTLKVMIAQN
ncbi:MAG: Aldose 1-epimerase family protein YeaD [uncultured Sulfurovum sp.]|uniref:Putative glucose-6-phosphate 1-epimerase n=1 Tax=uncultured Sulfurovum sp. TaxID=269237 RepID=A0A6S6SYZ7_9BACT|nr:MAG: Aldose 1-epimerase family protein YeaD [uncultured Sulfurovum sp.]